MIAKDVKDLIDAGVFKRLISAGIIPAKVKAQYEMYVKYELYKAWPEASIDWNAISIVAVDFNVCDRTVYRAVKAMTQ